MEPLVSILIPAYNAEKWITETVRSAVNQTWSRKEIIVVDDGSTDTTLPRLSILQSKILKVITQPNNGACSARNHALQFAQGDFIQWLDADDLLHPEKITLQMKAFQKLQNDRLLFSSSFGVFYFRPSRSQFNKNSLWRCLSPVEWFVNKFANDDSLFPAVWLVSRRLTDMAGLWDENLTMDDDGEYFGRVIACSEAIPFVQEAKSFYRQANPGSISKTINHRACHSLFSSYQRCIGYMLSLEDSEETRSAALKYLQTNLIYFYPEEIELLGLLMDLARGLGGDLHPPHYSSKYWIFNMLFGLHTTKVIAGTVRGMRQRAIRGVDKIAASFLNNSPDANA